MKQHKLFSLFILLSVVLVPLATPTAAQESTFPDTVVTTPEVEVQRAPAPAKSSEKANPPAAPDATTWQFGPPSPFQWTRFDGAFVEGPTGEAWANKVYFPGGRTGTAPAHDRNIWSFDPVTGAYADTGVDMLINISNYVANVVHDDGTARGPAIYIIGGYDADAAANHGQVQRYYPQSGTVEVLPPADDWTATVAGSMVGAMGSAVVNDVIYVFGGWENAAPPYFYDGTWAFDPSQPSGSRWTNLGLTISPGRSYPQVAVKGSMVYAMGGVYQFVTTPATDLVPTDVVEALDTANLGAGWQPLASMPVAGAEGRGFGFGADTLGLNAAFDEKIYVVGAADWSDGSLEVMEYDVANDFWDQAFPDLNEDRRDHAGVFVSLDTPDPNDGLPGMWVFGGRWDSGDAPPFAPTEYYGLEYAPQCNVLLVDDDWDFDTVVPNDGGRQYYTSTLDALGVNYNLWDTISMGTPTAGDMGAYNAVVWFTGYDWQTPITPTEEIELMSYLDAGGNLLMSSQEQEYAFPGSTIMSDYFWVAGVSEDVIITNTVGNSADPLFSALGPYTMGRPDAWAAYWPVGGFEGPYDDEVAVKPGGFEPMLYVDSMSPNSTRFQGAGFRTVYLGWPFEWLPDLADRTEVMSTTLNWLCFGDQGALELIPPAQAGDGVPGAEVPYTLEILNDLGSDETFDISYASNWAITGPATVGPVPNGGNETLRRHSYRGP